MTEIAQKRRLSLLVLSSTYPRWPDDPEPGFVHELAKRLADDFEVTVVGPHAHMAQPSERMDRVMVRRYRYAPARWETLVNNGGIVTNLKRTPLKWFLVPSFLLAQVWAVARILRRCRPDVIHVHWLLPQGAVVALLSLVCRLPPVLLTSHGADLFALRSRPLRALKRFVTRRATRFTVVSAAMEDELVLLGVAPADVDVQSMGTDLGELFTPDSNAQRSDAEILFVGRLVEKKGLRHLVEALPAIIAVHPRAHLTIAGFGPEEQALRRQVDAGGLAGRITFLGAVSQKDLPMLYRRAAVFVAPFVQAASGDQEGLGLVVIEALGCGCPVVVSDLPATREILPGHTQPVRVPPGDAEAIARAVIDLLGHRREEAMASAAEGAQMLRERFDWRSVAAAYSRLLKQMVAKGEQVRSRYRGP